MRAWHIVLLLIRKLVIEDWQHKLRVLLTGLILLQFVRWFDEYWLSNTEWLVRAALACALAAELFPRIPPLLRRFASLAVLVFLHFYRLEAWLPEFSDIRSAGEAITLFGRPLVDALAQTAPYIYFALGSWLAYLLAIDLMRTRARIIMYTIACVIVFALVDSYSKRVMWDQAAFVVFSGLGLIIVEHYERFRKKHPESWAYLAEYPGKVALPIVSVVAIVMLAGIVAPNARPLLTDPYTLYKHWRGEQVVTGGKGFSVNLETIFEPLSSSSGYGRDDRELGGGFDYDYSEVMRIQTTQRSYWRGETKSLYTGSGWLASETDWTGEIVRPGDELKPYDWGYPDAEQARTVRVEQKVTMTVDRASREFPDYPVLFGASPIRSFKIGDETEQQLRIARPDRYAGETLWSRRQSELRWNSPPDEYPLQYELVSAVPVTNPAAWQSVGTVEYTDSRWADYLQLPDTLPQRVRDLAADITANATNQYDRVKLIEQYLKNNYTYKNKPDDSRGRSADFVDRFLFEIKEGYCDYYSTAMTVMVRSLGIPARWVKGFKPGVNELEEHYRMGGAIPREVLEELEAQRSGTFIVRNADAHSWVEVYFPGFGWLPFEPTSGASLPVIDSPDAASEPVSALPESGVTEGVVEEELLPWLSPAAAAIGIVVAVAATAVAAAVYLLVRRGYWRRAWLFVRYRRREAKPLELLALQEISRIFKLLRRKGYDRSAHETARESIARWASHNIYLKKDLDTLLSILEKARYSPYGISSDDMAALQRTRLRLKEEL